MEEPLKEPSIVSERTHDREGGFAGQRGAGNTEFNGFWRDFGFFGGVLEELRVI